jgi:hypothetical protein
MTVPQARDLLDALGLAEKRRVASGRYVTATTGPAETWLYFVTYRTRSGFWFGACPLQAKTEIPADVLTFLEKEGFEPTKRNFEAIRRVGETVRQAVPEARLVMVELQELLSGFS